MSTIRKVEDEEMKHTRQTLTRTGGPKPRIDERCAKATSSSQPPHLLARNLPTTNDCISPLSLGTFVPLCVVCGLVAGAGIGFSIAWFGTDGGSTHDHKERDKSHLESGTSSKDSYFPDPETENGISSCATYTVLEVEGDGKVYG
ncbi:hypothetical protein Tcan_14509 [Toxocara canis]|uniref:Uncharacterized protein n=1 Tax=Toxocara canis TaxID=6265 RepID=A0A0B2V9T5_TOXCA|nr:hypothetical protein Tcan_14509 [Toxocara canis]